MVLLLPLDDVNLADLVWLVVRQQLRKGHVITGERVDTIEYNSARDAVVPVGGEDVGRAMRVLSDDEIGPPPSDLAGDVSPEVARVLHLSVVVAEELDVVYPDSVRGGPLLRLADPGKTVRGHRAVPRSHIAAGDDDINDLGALPYQPGHRASCASLRVVGVSRHHHRALDHRRPTFGSTFSMHGDARQGSRRANAEVLPEACILLDALSEETPYVAPSGARIGQSSEGSTRSRYTLDRSPFALRPHANFTRVRAPPAFPPRPLGLPGMWVS